MTEEEQKEAAVEPKTQDRAVTVRPNIFVRFWQWLKGIDLIRLNKRLFWAYYILMIAGLLLFCYSVIYVNLIQEIETYFWLFVIIVYLSVLTLVRLISYILIRFLPPFIKKRRTQKLGNISVENAATKEEIQQE